MFHTKIQKMKQFKKILHNMIKSNVILFHIVLHHPNKYHIP